MGILQELGDTLANSVRTAVEPIVTKAAAKTGTTELVESTGRTVKSALDQAHELMMRAAAPGHAMLHSLGLGEMAETMRASDVAAKLAAGNKLSELHEALAPFRKQDAWLDKLSVKYHADDMSHIVDLIQNPLEKARSEAHANAAEVIQGHLDDIGLRSEDINLSVYSGARYEAVLARAKNAGKTDEEAARIAAKAARRPFQRRENYFPHYFDEATIQKYLRGELHEETLKKILDRQLAQDRAEAKAVLTRMLRAPSEFRGGVLQHTRSGLDLQGYDRDLVNVMTRYYLTSERRLAQAAAFGVDDKVALAAIMKLDKKDPSSRQIAMNIYRGWAGSSDPQYRDLARFTNTLHAMSMLSTSGIVQPTQLNNTAAIIGWGNTLKALSVVAKDWRKAKLDATNMGAIFDNVHKDFAPREYKGLGEMWSRLIGLDSLDRVNRVVSAVGGRLWAQQTVDKMLGASANDLAVLLARHGPAFKEMGINLEEVLARGVDTGLPAGIRGRGLLNDDELRRAGLYVSSNSQFTSDALSLPEFKDSTAGQFLYLFKSYALQQSNFVQKHIVKPAAAGDATPAMRYLAGLLGGGVTLGSAVRLLKHRETPDDHKVRVLEDMALAGGFGMYFDAFRAMANGPQSVLNFVAGPTISEGAQVLGSDIPAIIEGAVNESQPNFEPVLKHLTGRIPLAGQYLKNTIYDD